MGTSWDPHIEQYIEALNLAAYSAMKPRSGRPFTVKTKSGITGLVDEEDDWVRDYAWHTHKSSQNVYLCHAFDSNMHINLHSLLLPPVQRGIDVHHIDGDSLNNRRFNLRYASHSENITFGRAIRAKAVR